MPDQLSELATVKAIQITARRNGQFQGSCQLSSGNTVIVGSGQSCSLVLQGPDVSPMHCLVSFDGTVISIQEWTGTQGVCVNGQPINGEADIDVRDVICLGEFDLSFSSVEQANATTPNWVADSDGEIDSENSVERKPSDELVHSTMFNRVGNAPRVVDRLSATGPIDNPELPDAFSHPEADVETIATLRAEISVLQSELADRDALLGELESDAFNDNTVSRTSFEDDASLQRLDELLEELAQSDERMGLLEELITASEVAASAERDERRQLEAWVAGIEQRISANESESQAEIETLVKQVTQLRSERDRAQLQLQNAASGDDVKAEFNNSLQELRRENTELGLKLEQLESQRTELQQQLDSADVQNAIKSHQDQLNEALREERAKLAQQTADLTRSRAVLANQLAEIQRGGLTGQENGADERVRALRNHLKDIHEQERDETEQRQGLMSRIAGLWRSVDGRAAGSS